MKVIGLTGNMATGKTVVAAYLTSLGAMHIDADKIAHELVEQPDVIEKIVNQFGIVIIDSKGRIDRRKLGDIVFTDRDKMNTLEGLLHPLIREKIEEQLLQYDHKDIQIVVVSAAILIEAGWTSFADEIWLLHAPNNVLISRAVARDGLSEEQVIKRLTFQNSFEKNKKYAQVVINTSGDFEKIKPSILQAYHQLLNEGKPA